MSEVSTRSINEVQLICGFLLHTADNPIWEQRVKNGSGELWEFAFASLIHQDKLIARGLMPSNTISVRSNEERLFPYEDELIAELTRIDEERYSLSIYKDGTFKARISFGEGDTILKLDKELASNPIERQRHLILGMLALRKELESMS